MSSMCACINSHLCLFSIETINNLLQFITLDDKDLNDKTMLPVLKVSLTHIMCSISVCQMHKETAEWLNECVLMNFFTKNKSLLK